MPLSVSSQAASDSGAASVDAPYFSPQVTPSHDRDRRGQRGYGGTGLPRVRSHALFLNDGDLEAGTDGTNGGERIIVPKKISLAAGSPDLQYDMGCCAMQGASARMEDRVMTYDLSYHPHFNGCQRAVLMAVLDGHAGNGAVSHLEANLVHHILEEVAHQLGCAPVLELPQMQSPQPPSQPPSPLTQQYNHHQTRNLPPSSPPPPASPPPPSQQQQYPFQRQSQPYQPPHARLQRQQTQQEQLQQSQEAKNQGQVHQEEPQETHLQQEQQQQGVQQQLLGTAVECTVRLSASRSAAVIDGCRLLVEEAAAAAISTVAQPFDPAAAATTFEQQLPLPTSHVAETTGGVPAAAVLIPGDLVDLVDLVDLRGGVGAKPEGSVGASAETAATSALDPEGREGPVEEAGREAGAEGPMGQPGPALQKREDGAEHLQQDEEEQIEAAVPGPPLKVASEMMVEEGAESRAAELRASSKLSTEMRSPLAARSTYDWSQADVMSSYDWDGMMEDEDMDAAGCIPYDGDGGPPPPWSGPPRRHSAAEERRRTSLAAYDNGCGCQPPDPAAALRNALLRCERDLMDQDCHSGTTALVALMLGPRLWLANVGDCRAVICDDGEARQLTVDHKAGSGRPGAAEPVCGAALLERQRLLDLGVQLSSDGYLQVTAPDGSCSDIAVSRNLGCAHLKDRSLSGRGSSGSRLYPLHTNEPPTTHPHPHHNIQSPYHHQPHPHHLHPATGSRTARVSSTSSGPAGGGGGGGGAWRLSAVSAIDGGESISSCGLAPGAGGGGTGSGAGWREGSAPDSVLDVGEDHAAGILAQSQLEAIVGGHMHGEDHHNDLNHHHERGNREHHNGGHNHNNYRVHQHQDLHKKRQQTRRRHDSQTQLPSGEAALSGGYVRFTSSSDPSALTVPPHPTRPQQQQQQQQQHPERGAERGALSGAEECSGVGSDGGGNAWDAYSGEFQSTNGQPYNRPTDNYQNDHLSLAAGHGVLRRSVDFTDSNGELDGGCLAHEVGNGGGGGGGGGCYQTTMDISPPPPGLPRISTCASSSDTRPPLSLQQPLQPVHGSSPRPPWPYSSGSSYIDHSACTAAVPVPAVTGPYSSIRPQGYPGPVTPSPNRLPYGGGCTTPNRQSSMEKDAVAADATDKFGTGAAQNRPSREFFFPGDDDSASRFGFVTRSVSRIETAPDLSSLQPGGASRHSLGLPPLPPSQSIGASGPGGDGGGSGGGGGGCGSGGRVTAGVGYQIHSRSGGGSGGGGIIRLRERSLSPSSPFTRSSGSGCYPRLSPLEEDGSSSSGGGGGRQVGANGYSNGYGNGDGRATVRFSGSGCDDVEEPRAEDGTAEDGTTASSIAATAAGGTAEAATTPGSNRDDLDCGSGPEPLPAFATSSLIAVAAASSAADTDTTPDPPCQDGGGGSIILKTAVTFSAWTLESAFVQTAVPQEMMTATAMVATDTTASSLGPSAEATSSVAALGTMSEGKLPYGSAAAISKHGSADAAGGGAGGEMDCRCNSDTTCGSGAPVSDTPCVTRSSAAGALIPDPDLFYYEISQDYEFLICACDGLWDVMRNGEACRYVRRWLTDGRSSTSAAEDLCRVAVKLGSHDNVSAVILKFSARPLARAASSSRLRRAASEAQL